MQKRGRAGKSHGYKYKDHSLGKSDVQRELWTRVKVFVLALDYLLGVTARESPSPVAASFKED